MAVDYKRKKGVRAAIIATMPSQHATIARTELFELLAGGRDAGATVLTPNRRLAQALARAFDRDRQVRGCSAWETADILPFGAFVQRLWEDALFTEAAEELPLLLTPSQEQVLWEECIAAARIGHAAFAAPAAASQCREAWQLQHAWGVDPAADAAGEDTRAYLDWAARYARLTREHRQTDAARLPEVMAPLLARGALPGPAEVILHGFDLVTPQTSRFLERLAAQGCRIRVTAAAPPPVAAARRVELADAKGEIEAAAAWARARLEADSEARIGVVVPDLARSRARVARIFARVMSPAHRLSSDAALPVNVTLGAPLPDFPLAGDALFALALAGPEVAFEDASRVLRSPFVAGAEKEMEARARLDAWLRERSAPVVRLDVLLRLADSKSAPAAPLLRERLHRLAEHRKAALFGSQAAPAWARGFTEALRILGFPGERTLDSFEHQALERWHELLAELASLERVIPRMGFAEALARTRAMAREAIFQPEAPQAPVQVMGVLESAGLEFDHLWVMGLTDDAWPLPARANPFIPVRLQRAAGVPQADPRTSLELDRRITAGWLAAAGEVVVSHARMRDEAELAPSPLIAAIAAADPDERRARTLREAIRAVDALEAIDDGQGPPAPPDLRQGGTSLFRDQAACPFRAFARHRLASDDLETTCPGLDLRDRGTLLHAMLAAVWKALESSERLAALAPADLEALLGASADEAIATVQRYRSDVLSGRFAALERARLIRLAGEWLAMEARRPPFEVVALEEKRAVTFGGVTVNAKLDRMDVLAAGGRAVIDYKTGVCATKDWMGQRPDEPQLPMYALTHGDVAAAAFGVVKAGGMVFKGVARAKDLIPGVTTIDKDRSHAAKAYRTGGWAQLVEGWARELETLGREFSSGEARVDPKRGSETCDKCDQHMFCRISERAPFGVARKADADE
jgi:probable DNA repair protein